MLSMENLPQLNWKHWNMFRWPEQEATVSSARSFEFFQTFHGLWDLFPPSWRWKWGIGLPWDKQTEEAKRCKCTVGWSSPSVSVIYLCSIIRLWRGVKQSQAAPLPSNWPDLSARRRSLLGIWRHLTEAHLQISSSSSIQSIPLFTRSILKRMEVIISR